MDHQRHSNRGIGIRFLLALLLPVTGVVLNVWTVTQLCIYHFSLT